MKKENKTKEEKLDIKKIREKLKKYHQEHLLIKYDSMNEAEKKRLLSQINNIDFELMKKLYKEANEEIGFDDVELEPAPHVDKSRMSKAEQKEYMQRGIEEIKDGKLAIVTMAGGQGTRLRSYWSQRNILSGFTNRCKINI